MNSERIKEIQQGTAYPDSISVQQALLQVWNECEQQERMYSEEEVFELLLKHQSDYRSSVRNTSPLNWSFDIKEWFEEFKKK